MFKIKRILIVLFLALGYGFFNYYGQISKDDSKSFSNIQNPKSEIKRTNLTKVIHVVDGDTIIVNINGIDERIRLIGINTPESVKPDSQIERYGIEASEFTKNLLMKNKISLEFDIQTRDKYGRLLAYVYLKDGRMLNKILVQEGYAQVMTVPPNIKYQEQFIILQREAKENKKGLWQ